MSYKLCLPLLSALSIVLFLSSCAKKNFEDITAHEENITSLIYNEYGGSLETHLGTKVQIIPGTLPSKKGDSNCSSMFSIEIKDETITSLPSGYRQAINKVYQIGPEAFIFNLPAKVYFPIGKKLNPYNVAIARYNAFEEKWTILPTSEFLENPNRIGTSVIELGKFTLVEITDSQETQNLKSNNEIGGIKLNSFIDNDYWYSISVERVSLKFPNQEESYSDLINSIAGVSGTNEKTKTALNPLYICLPQGEYTIWISRMKWDKAYGGKWETHHEPITIKIDNPLEKKSFSNDLGLSYDGWVPINIENINWRVERPIFLPLATEIVGTGKFQATLTWVNNFNTQADIDLHLFGPNDFHIYFANPSPSGSAFNLDRDWLIEMGNAIENIYSISDSWDKGKYTLEAHHYSGDLKKPYNVRVIHENKVNTYSGSHTKYNQKDVIYSFIIE